jgi:hypothetical protein
VRTFGISIRRNVGLHAPSLPDRGGKIKSPSHRRLHDSLEEVFFRACATRDLDSAADLLMVLEKWHERRATRYGRERRISDGGIKMMRAELERLRGRA